MIYYIVEVRSDIMFSPWRKCCDNQFYDLQSAQDHIDVELPNAHVRIVKITMEVISEQ